MILLLPLIVTIVAVRTIAGVFARRGSLFMQEWASWEAAAAAGLSVVYLSTSVTHFVEPQRSGLVAIVPSFIPLPALMVTLTGVIELLLVAGLIVAKTRVWAALASIGLLVAMFPANIVAAAGVNDPAAPSTPLGPRLALQIVLIGCSALILVARRQDLLSAVRPRLRTSPSEDGHFNETQQRHAYG